MSREIRFRAWDKEKRQMEYIDDLYWFEENGVHDGGGEGFHTSYDLMQFTGLITESGTDIYEGDILRVFEYYCEEEPDLNEWKDVVVEWDDNGCCLSIEWNYGDYDITAIGWAFQIFDNYGCKVEVIGNIHENPELLEVQA